MKQEHTRGACVPGQAAGGRVATRHLRRRPLQASVRARGDERMHDKGSAAVSRPSSRSVACMRGCGRARVTGEGVPSSDASSRVLLKPTRCGTAQARIERCFKQKGQRTAAVAEGHAVGLAVGVVLDVDDVEGREALEEAAAAEHGEEVVRVLAADVECGTLQH